MYHVYPFVVLCLVEMHIIYLQGNKSYLYLKENKLFCLVNSFWFSLVNDLLYG